MKNDSIGMPSTAVFSPDIALARAVNGDPLTPRASSVSSRLKLTRLLLTTTLILAVSWLFLTSGTVLAHERGHDGPYSILNPPQPTLDGSRVEVIEFFWYGCPHCYSLEPVIARWLEKKPKDVVFKRVPAIFSESWGRSATMFYALEAMGLLDQLHSRIFDAIHKDKILLDHLKTRDDWLVRQGVDIAKYREVEKSFTVAGKVARAKQLTQDYKLESVPTIAVGGKYVTSAEQAGGAGAVFTVVDKLVQLSRKN